MRGQIKRYLDVMELDGDEQVVLVLAPKVERESNRNKWFTIQEKNLWRYTEEYNPDFVPFMMGLCFYLFDLFDLGLPSTRQLAETAATIQDGITEMMDAIPDTTTDADKLITGEALITINGQKHSAGVTESGLLIL